MPKKKPLDIPSEFVDQVLTIIANESDAGRKKIVAISKRAEEKYDSPVKSWITGWVYQYTRTRGGEIKQSIKVMEDFPDAYTRLQEFKLMVSKGEWNIGSYNYFLFLELIDAIPDYEPLEEQFQQAFILRLKDLVMKQIDSYMAQYKVTLEEIKAREIERQATRQSASQFIENVLIFNNLDAAKEAQSKQQDKIAFCLNFKSLQWHLTWLDVAGEMFPLSLSSELAQKLATLEDQDIEKLTSVQLKRIKRECIKSRDLYLEKIQLTINPEDSRTHTVLTNNGLAEKGVTSTFILRTAGDESGLWWINSMGVPNKISLTNYPELDSWLSIHKDPFNEAEILHLKINLLHVKTAQSFSSTKMEQMNSMLLNVLNKTGKQGEPGDVRKTAVVTHKLDLGLFKDLEQHLKNRLEKTVFKTPTPSSNAVVDDESTKVNTSKKLSPDRYTALSQLTSFWQQHKIDTEVQIEANEVRPHN